MCSPWWIQSCFFSSFNIVRSDSYECRGLHSCAVCYPSVLKSPPIVSLYAWSTLTEHSLRRMPKNVSNCWWNSWDASRAGWHTAALSWESPSVLRASLCVWLAFMISVHRKKVALFWNGLVVCVWIEPLGAHGGVRYLRYLLSDRWHTNTPLSALGLSEEHAVITLRSKSPTVQDFTDV